MALNVFSTNVFCVVSHQLQMCHSCQHGIRIEDESVCKVRNKVVVKRQGASVASEYCNSESLDGLQASLANLKALNLRGPWKVHLQRVVPSCDPMPGKSQDFAC